MKVVERRSQVVVPGKWDEFMEHEKRWAEADKPYGAPLKRALRAITGSHAFATYIWEREWDSMAAMEAHYTKQWEDTSLRPLMEKSLQIGQNQTIEYYMLME